MQTRCVGPFDTAMTAHSYDDFSEIYDMLAEMPFSAEPDALDLSTLPDANLGAVRSLHVLTHRPSPDLLETLRILAGRRCTVTCLCPDFPYARQLAAACPEEVRLLLITRPADILTELGDAV